MKKIGFVGLGNIGQPASLNLLRAGHEVVGFDPHPNSALIHAGGRMARDLEEIAQCDLIIQSLPSPKALAATLDGLLPHLPRGRVIADISSYPLEIKEAAAERLARAEVEMLDCEISGLPIQVAQKKAVLFVSGGPSAMEGCADIFDALAGRHFFLGAFGAATKMKLIANFMVCAHNLIGAEALNLGRAAGLDPARMVEVLTPSAAGSTTFANKAQLMLSREFDNGPGPFRYMFGYLDRALELARTSGIGDATPILDRVREIYAIAEREQRHDQDIAGIIEVIEQMAAEEESA
ncbi:NAD(P)-dependent oxidoreductase [Novosphingobium flavum]|uniref:NAD(P)-dependent oxidoreductase n=1 Tax=Novosphingobium aerophilum TaxID=2839843 RepID=UPI001639957D|nr:NAD(P)-dependent oxidoreductase [Novosphingobium aerophilum]MBC2662775.1 NAD(P)-dependent oxidoreductase [Novosphingobium aerophilum]